MNVCYKWVIGFCLAMFMPFVAEAQSVHGVLRVVKGNVQIKSGKNGQTSRARMGEKVYPKDTVITAKDSRAKIVMVDNNEINVSPESQIEIQNYEFDPAAGKKDVLLNVIYGKVRSKVEQKYDGKTSKFQIKTPSAVAGVRGTDFLTGFQAGVTNVVTFEGKVDFGMPGPNGTIRNPVSVTPGMSATAVMGAPPTPPVPVPKTELAKMDGDTKADGPKPNAPPAGDQRAPSNDSGNKENKDNNRDGAKNEPKNDGQKGNGQGNSGNGKGNGGPNGGPKAGAPGAGGEGDKNANNNSGPKAEGGRAPASGSGAPKAGPGPNAPPPGGCTMCGGDVAGPTGPVMPPPPPPPMACPGGVCAPVGPVLACPGGVCLPDAARDQISGGATKLKIIVNTPAQ